MSAADWIVYALNDLKTAKAAVAEEVTNNACFHSHQTVEKCLKAILLLKEKEIPKVHDLLFLLGKVRVHEPSLSRFEEEIRFLNQFYIPMRYPDAFPGNAQEGLPTKEEAQKAIENADKILNFVKSIVGEE